jgi:hypothetical protein
MKVTNNLLAGTMPGYNLYNLTPNVIDVLLIKKAISIEGFASSDEMDFWGFMQPCLRNFFVFQNKAYEINSEIKVEIFNCLKAFVESDKQAHSGRIKLYKVSLEIELNKFLTKDKKISYLTNKYDEQFKLFESTYTCDIDGPELKWDDLSSAKPDSEEWKNYILESIEGSHPNLIFHLNYGEYDQWGIDYLYDKINEQETFNFIEYWIDWLYIHQIENYSENLINSLKYETKSELIKIQQKYSLDYIDTNYTRFPAVFKNPKSCELFFYFLAKNGFSDDVDFSVYYEIFKKDHFKENITSREYRNLVKGEFGVKLKRLRSDFSSEKYTSFVKAYIKAKREFDEEILTRNNN